jgi:hypothetical protein
MGSDDRRYLDGVPGEVADRLAAASRAGLAALRNYLDSGQALAFLGAGVSARCGRRWSASWSMVPTTGMPPDRAQTCRQVAEDRPDTVVNPAARWDRRRVFAAVDAASFTGRGWLTRQADALLGPHQSGLCGWRSRPGWADRPRGAPGTPEGM